jgi:hypothetical protein
MIEMNENDGAGKVEPAGAVLVIEVMWSSLGRLVEFYKFDYRDEFQPAPISSSDMCYA